MQYRPHRYQTEFPLDLRAPSGPQRCKVMDVNNAGARLVGVRDVKRGDKLQFKILSCRVDAVVHWTTGDRAGIVFRPQITDAQLDTLRYRKDGRTDHRRGRIGFAFEEMR